MCVCVCVCVCSEGVCVRRRCVGLLVATAGHFAVCTARRAAACALALGSSVGSRVLAAGITWTDRETSAPLKGRIGYTTVIDAAGAIYIIGGGTWDGSIYYQDAWASTDGGARTGLARGCRGDLVGTSGVLPDTTGLLWGTQGVLRAPIGVLEYSRGVYGYLGGT
jgi:hypothetical protein